MSLFRLTFVVSILATAVCFAQEKAASAEKPSQKTRALLSPWLREAEKVQQNHLLETDASKSTLQELLKQPDADWALLEFMDARAGFDWPFLFCSSELGKLNSQRTFEVLAARLKSADMFVRERAISYLRDFKLRPGTVPLLVDVLEHDKVTQVRFRAAETLKFFKDPRSEPALLRAVQEKDFWLAACAAQALAELNSADGAVRLVELVKRAKDDQQRTYAMEAMGAYRRKAIINAVLEVYSHTPRVSEIHMGRVKFAPDWAGRVQMAASAAMKHCFETTGKINGPQPDDFYEQWQEWWDKTEPLLTDDLKLKVPLKAGEVKYADADYGHDPKDLEFEISVDSDTYRFRDPIRLDLKVTNKSDKPYRIILPKPPSGWMPTMAYGIQLERDGKQLINIEPSDDYLGSYSGPPGFETLAPHQTFQSSVCLQYFLEWPFKGVWPKGEYEFTLTFDSGKFAGAHARGVEMLGSWTAKPVRFKIEGEERTDTKEIFELIAKKARLPYLRTDFEGYDYERREGARHAMFQYADERLKTDTSLPEWVRSSRYIRDR